MTPETELRAALDELRRKQVAMTDRITAALLAGDDTAPIRAEAATLGREITAINQRLADVVMQREAATLEAISAAGATIAADATATILAKLSALAAPEHP
jgi:translation initiation factor 1 (eIF-1/SUI1)